MRDQTVLEIGAGEGALTELLSRRARKLIAIEFDRILATQLRVKYAQKRHVEVIEADILSLDFVMVVTQQTGLMRQPGRRSS